MPRLTRRVDLRFHADAAVHLTDHGRFTRSGDLVVRVHGDHLRAHRNSSSYNSLPRFRGRTERTPDGLTVHGQIKEAFGAALWTRGYACATVLMLAILVLGAVQIGHGDRVGLAPLLIGAVGSVAFAVLWSIFHGRRRPQFAQQSDQLTDDLQRYLATGDVEQSYS